MSPTQFSILTAPLLAALFAAELADK